MAPLDDAAGRGEPPPVKKPKRKKPAPAKRQAPAKPSRTPVKPTRPAREKAAVDFYVAQRTRRAAEMAWSAALTGAIKAGVVPNYLAEPEPVGTNRLVYADRRVQIMLSVVAGIEGLDVVGFLDWLVANKVDPRLVARGAAKFRTETRPAHRFTSTAVA
jgi:hypothetical protein